MPRKALWSKNYVSRNTLVVRNGGSTEGQKDLNGINGRLIKGKLLVPVNTSVSRFLFSRMHLYAGPQRVALDPGVVDQVFRPFSTRLELGLCRIL